MDVIESVTKLVDLVFAVGVLVVSGVKVYRWYGKDWQRAYFWLSLAVFVSLDMRLSSIISALTK